MPATLGHEHRLALAPPVGLAGTALLRQRTVRRQLV